MHTNNLHLKPYDFKVLIEAHAPLEQFVFTNPHGVQTIDFSLPKGVLALNTAILKSDYELLDWNIPEGYLCPPIPGRVDYIHHIADLLKENGYAKEIKGLDIGMGANCIYPLLGAQIYGWQMVGCDIDANAVKAAKVTMDANPQLLEAIDIRHQNDHANLFEGIIKPDEFFHFTMCNPPFYASEKEALRHTQQKQKNLGISSQLKRNFGGAAHEIWCNGGEALFIKRMIKQSAQFNKQVGVFTSLVSKSEHLPKIKKQLTKLKAVYKIVAMEHGNKKSRIVAWKF